MSLKLAVLIWSVPPEQPHLIATPLVHALAALALETEVEIHFAGPAVRWLAEGVAERAYTTPSQEKRVADFLAEVREAGATLYACGMARAHWIAPEEALRPDVSMAGATTFISRTLDPEWRTLLY